MSNLTLLLFLFFVTIISGTKYCGDIGYNNSTYTLVYLKSPLPRTGECSKDLRFSYLYEGPVTMWTKQNKDPFIYINIPEGNSTTCYFVLLKEHHMKSCYVQTVWKAEHERVVLFETKNPSKQGYIGDIKKHLKQGCTNQEKLNAFFEQCVNHPVLRIAEYSAHIKQFSEDEKIQYQLHATDSQPSLQQFCIKSIFISIMFLSLLF
uniref:Uncharacterized protein LOC114324204 n=1 Tax=Diabrotica virgifera virgifera TaxID=50390 RepID=A0A6P7EYV5_DIAVI